MGSCWWGRCQGTQKSGAWEDLFKTPGESNTCSQRLGSFWFLKKTWLWVNTSTERTGKGEGRQTRGIFLTPSVYFPISWKNVFSSPPTVTSVWSSWRLKDLLWEDEKRVLFICWCFSSHISLPCGMWVCMPPCPNSTDVPPLVLPRCHVTHAPVRRQMGKH